MTLTGHKPSIISFSGGKHEEHKGVPCISYFPDGKQMSSGSHDETIRRWDLQEGKEIEDAREVFGNGISAVGVSRDGRWVVTASLWSLKVSEVETGIVRTFHEGKWLSCIEISADSKLLVGASSDLQGWIWRLDTGKLVAGPFKFIDGFIYLSRIALRLSEDSRKLAVVSNYGCCLQVWDVQTQKLDVQKSISLDVPRSFAPIFWTTKHKSIVATFDLTADATIYEFDALTLETVGAPFKGHTHIINNLALSSDRVLLVSSSYDKTIKLWTFESRQLLASFDIESPILTLVLSPNSRQLAYKNWDDCNINIYNIPAIILASIGLAEEPQPTSVCIPH
jgi:WD40 repeat protein